MTIKITNILNAGLIGLTCLIISACGSKKIPADEAEVANTSDITRPPSIVKNRKPAESESNPNETISYDDWKRRRDAEIAGD